MSAWPRSLLGLRLVGNSVKKKEEWHSNKNWWIFLYVTEDEWYLQGWWGPLRRCRLEGWCPQLDPHRLPGFVWMSRESGGGFFKGWKLPNIWPRHCMCNQPWYWKGQVSLSLQMIVAISCCRLVGHVFGQCVSGQWLPSSHTSDDGLAQFCSANPPFEVHRFPQTIQCPVDTGGRNDLRPCPSIVSE